MGIILIQIFLTVGDPFKVINWKATAKIGKIMSNEHESERKVDVVIVLDAGYLGANVIDYSVRAAASLMLDCLKNGTSFGLLLSESVPLWARVDYGKRHFFKCVDLLSTVKPDKNNLIAYQVEHLIRTRFPANAQIIYVSPLVSEESRKALKKMYHSLPACRKKTWIKGPCFSTNAGLLL